jgi:steroid 5-alpha reductase family enzyme
MVKGLLLVNALAILVVMSTAFVAAKNRKRLDIVDIAWVLSFVVAASIVAGYEFTWRTVTIAVLVDVWAIRLSNHLLERAKSRKEDPRYTAIAKKWKGDYWLNAYIRIFLVQALLAWLVTLPIVLAAGKGSHLSTVFIILGVLVWLKGFLIETIADRQLATFLKTNKGIMQTGLWRYSRHPNYYGEIVHWLGIALIACGAHNGWLGFIGPLILIVTIIFISGIPPIEKAKANDLEYQKYKRHTSPLVPWFPKQ